MARHWMAPMGIRDDMIYSRTYDEPVTWDGQPGREIIPVVVGSREWAMIQCYRGERVVLDDGQLPWTLEEIVRLAWHANRDGWHLLPPAPPPIRKGERVKGIDLGGVEWIGPYWEPDTGHRGGRWMGSGGGSIHVEFVSRIEEERT